MSITPAPAVLPESKSPDVYANSQNKKESRTVTASASPSSDTSVSPKKTDARQSHAKSESQRHGPAAKQVKDSKSSSSTSASGAKPKQAENEKSLNGSNDAEPSPSAAANHRLQKRVKEAQREAEQREAEQRKQMEAERRKQLESEGAQRNGAHYDRYESSSSTGLPPHMEPPAAAVPIPERIHSPSP
jgi:hypothetical protein